MHKKSSIQKRILEIISGKRAVKTDAVAAEVQLLLEKESPETRYAVNRALKNMHERGLIELHSTGRSRFSRLTSKGRRRLRSFKLDDSHQLAPMSWDGYWRIVMLSIPEERKDERDAFRYLLKKANFVCTKNAMWISPYPLEHLLENLKTDFGFTDEVMVIVSNQIDHKTEQYFVDSCAQKTTR